MDLRATLSQNPGLDPYQSEFLAKDEIVTILAKVSCSTNFDLGTSSVPIPALKQGSTISVPLWVAIELRRKNLCSMLPPAWLNEPTLNQIWSFEKASPGHLLPLTFYWQEIAKLYLLHAGEDLGSTQVRHDLTTILRSIEDVRANKITVIAKSLDLLQQDDVPILLIQNITSCELTRFRSFFVAQVSALMQVYKGYYGVLDQHRIDDEQKHEKFYALMKQQEDVQKREKLKNELHKMKQEKQLQAQMANSATSFGKYNPQNSFMQQQSSFSTSTTNPTNNTKPININDQLIINNINNNASLNTNQSISIPSSNNQSNDMNDMTDMNNQYQDYYQEDQDFDQQELSQFSQQTQKSQKSIKNISKSTKSQLTSQPNQFNPTQTRHVSNFNTNNSTHSQQQLQSATSTPQKSSKYKQSVPTSTQSPMKRQQALDSTTLSTSTKFYQPPSSPVSNRLIHAVQSQNNSFNLGRNTYQSQDGGSEGDNNNNTNNNFNTDDNMNDSPSTPPRTSSIHNLIYSHQNQQSNSSRNDNNNNNNIVSNSSQNSLSKLAQNPATIIDEKAHSEYLSEEKKILSQRVDAFTAEEEMLYNQHESQRRALLLQHVHNSNTNSQQSYHSQHNLSTTTTTTNNNNKNRLRMTINDNLNSNKNNQDNIDSLVAGPGIGLGIGIDGNPIGIYHNDNLPNVKNATNILLSSSIQYSNQNQQQQHPRSRTSLNFDDDNNNTTTTTTTTTNQNEPLSSTSISTPTFTSNFHNKLPSSMTLLSPSRTTNTNNNQQQHIINQNAARLATIPSTPIPHQQQSLQSYSSQSINNQNISTLSMNPKSSLGSTTKLPQMPNIQPTTARETMNEPPRVDLLHHDAYIQQQRSKLSQQQQVQNNNNNTTIIGHDNDNEGIENSPISSIESELYLEGIVRDSPLSDENSILSDHNTSQDDEHDENDENGTNGGNNNNKNDKNRKSDEFGRVNDLNGLLYNQFGIELESIQELEQVKSQMSQQSQQQQQQKQSQSQSQNRFTNNNNGNNNNNGRLISRGGVRRTAAQLGESYIDSQLSQVRREQHIQSQQQSQHYQQQQVHAQQQLQQLDNYVDDDDDSQGILGSQENE